MLSGSYVEAGDTGRHDVGPGDVIVHGAFESHLDRFGSQGADLLVLALPFAHGLSARLKLADPDEIVRRAERDPRAALELLIGTAVRYLPAVGDWPDALAADILVDPRLSLTEWARRHRLHPGTLARALRKQFAVTPAEFRRSARVQNALRRLAGSGTALPDIALASGFADQAHMSRDVRALTGHSPRMLRQSATNAAGVR